LSSLLLVLLLAGDLDAAERALRAGQPQEALELLGDLADGAEPDARACAVQGRAYLALGEYTLAVEPLVRAAAGRPDDRELSRDAALACFRAAEGAQAYLYLEDARRLAEASKDDALLAEVLYALGETEGALELYRKLAAEPKAVHAAMRVAACLEALGRADEARTAYATALEAALAARDIPAAYRAAFAGEHVGRLLAWLDERVAAEPDDLTYLHYRGFARSQVAMYAEAAEDLRAVLARNPGHMEARSRLSFVLMQLGVRRQDKAMLDEAARLAREVLDAEPANREAWDRVLWIAGYWWVNSDIERHFELLKDLHARDPADIDAALNYAAVARRLGHQDEAQAVYEQLLEASPRDPDVLNDYGIFVDGLGDREAARALWHRVLEEEPDNANALENLFTDAWERGDAAAIADLGGRGLAAARSRGEAVDRWLWFLDRLRWAPSGLGG
jgi:tetratricopeptide (TPR) repeat protein